MVLIMAFLNISSQMPKQYLKFGYDNFLLRPFQLIIHWSIYHLTLQNINYWKHHEIKKK
jgi:hypothetical protein